MNLELNFVKVDEKCFSRYSWVQKVFHSYGMILTFKCALKFEKSSRNIEHIGLKYLFSTLHNCTYEL